MKESSFRAAFDALEFSPDFQEQTKTRMRSLARDAERKEPMRTKSARKTLLIAAAICAVLALSVGAAFLLMSPGDVARELEEPALAQVFDDANLTPQSAVVGDYNITFAGVVSGENLTERAFYKDGNLVPNRSYAVFAFQKTDGTPIEKGVSLTDLGVNLTPLVYGHKPWETNIFTLGGAYESMVRDGVAYFIMDMDTLEQFEGEQIVFAAYAGGGDYPPSAAEFVMDADGTIRLTEQTDGVLFPVRTK